MHYIYIGPRSRDNEATPSIQQVTRGDAVSKLNRRSNTERRAPLKNWHVAFFLEKQKDIESQPMTLQHVAHKNPCGLALNYTNILDDPLNEGATDRITKN